MNATLRDIIRLLAEIIADELLTEQREGAEGTTLPSTYTPREGPEKAICYEKQ